MNDARESGPRWYATPLDRAAAAARARQLDALAEPDRLRVLSGVASRSDGRADATSLAGELDLEPDEVKKHLAVLIALELLEEVKDRPGTFMPTADTWMRFSRLIVAVEQPGNPAASRSERRASVGSEVELPPVLRRITERLAYRFSSTFSKETVERYVADSYRLLSERAKVSKHLPSLTTRFVEDRLNALAVASGRDLRGTPEVLFVCVCKMPDGPRWPRLCCGKWPETRCTSVPQACAHPARSTQRWWRSWMRSVSPCSWSSPSPSPTKRCGPLIT